MLSYQQCAGSVPGHMYTAPGRIIAVAYNGLLLPKNQPLPFQSWTGAGEGFRLNFNTQPGDRIDALIVPW